MTQPSTDPEEQADGIEALLERMGGKRKDPKGPPQFVMPGNRFLQVKKALKRPGIKKFIRPENARCVREHLPERGDHVHALLRGDFVLGDMIEHILESQASAHLRIATLGLSPHNAASLARLATANSVRKITIVCSHYFQQVNRDTTYQEVKNALDHTGIAQLVVTRSHAKVILAPTDSGQFYVIEGSSNLRSSDNLEQMTIFNDQELHDWHAAWIDDIATRETHQ